METGNDGLGRRHVDRVCWGEGRGRREEEDRQASLKPEEGGMGVRCSASPNMGSRPDGSSITPLQFFHAVGDGVIRSSRADEYSGWVTLSFGQ